MEMQLLHQQRSMEHERQQREDKMKRRAEERVEEKERRDVERKERADKWSGTMRNAQCEQKSKSAETTSIIR